ncbi:MULTISPECIES: hypothetical protein [unclassified Moorena]|uniref:hypothetical protein n=1 Tax=unclassified Moorena TaxID=2683338 RepID=UPI0013C5AF6A|nr:MULTISPECIES: hypothetical protein [unclassified Moorena]NEO23663.1 hypothetical protein [Moorena sp. SIO4A5]NEQ58478.1 hypothetical protein [Moorena sp. SIO4A1]
MQRGLGGFPHERLHQDNQSTYSPLCKKPTLMRIGRWGDGKHFYRVSHTYQLDSIFLFRLPIPDSRFPTPDSR